MISDRSILYGLLYKFVNVKTICHLFKNSKMYDDILYRAKVSHLTLHHNIRYKNPQMNEICSLVCPPLLHIKCEVIIHFHQIQKQSLNYF